MKTKQSVHLLLIAILAILPYSPCMAEREGHGGNSLAQDWVTHGYKALKVLESLPADKRFNVDLDQFSQMIRNASVKPVSKLPIQGKDAVNFPKETPPQIEFSQSRWATLSDDQKTALTMHEYFGLMGVEVDQYSISAAVMANASVVRNYDNSLDPIPLFEQSFDYGREGVSFQEAQKLCDQQKAMYRNRYFITYCVFHEKNWQEVAVGTSTYTSYELLGYETIASGSSSSFGIFMPRRGSANASSRSRYYSQTPVIMPVEVPYQYTYTVDHQIYGVKVFGWGLIDKSQMKTILKSDDLESGLDGITYPDSRQALIRCKLLTAAHDDYDFQFYRAECATVKRPDGTYAFEVKSYNPFIR